MSDSESTQERTGHTRRLRAVLKNARERQGLSQQDVADEIARIVGKGSHTRSAISAYESFNRHPPINVFAAWARAVGMRLIVDLEWGDVEHVQVRAMRSSANSVHQLLSVIEVEGSDRAELAELLVDLLADDSISEASLGVLEGAARAIAAMR